eukprot:TRINITY_DN33043_c0_g1_i1.p1 TRINITY_DN33043_c0_g1~~TRINITY_DN33043_c0_g1_i1.p1  ORF type:complete len:515 (+),score=57.35 TRINITY_DN33043_c0_g1_i1:106-1650(+)
MYCPPMEGAAASADQVNTKTLTREAVGSLGSAGLVDATGASSLRTGEEMGANSASGGAPRRGVRQSQRACAPDLAAILESCHFMPCCLSSTRKPFRQLAEPDVSDAASLDTAAIRARWVAWLQSKTRGVQVPNYDDVVKRPLTQEALERIMLAAQIWTPKRRTKRQERQRNGGYTPVSRQQYTASAVDRTRRDDTLQYFVARGSEVATSSEARIEEYERHCNLAWAWAAEGKLDSKHVNPEVLLWRCASQYLVSTLSVPLLHVDLQPYTARLRLKNLLIATVKLHSSVGFEPRMSLLAAALFVFFDGSVRSSFRAFAHIYSELHLDDYFSFTRSSSEQKQLRALKCDAMKVWTCMEAHFPSIVASFSRHGQEDLFFSVAEEWLTSLCLSCFNPDAQSLGGYSRLLEHILIFPLSASGDPRRQLRRAVSCIFARHEAAFSAADTADELVSAVSRLRACVVVDQELLELLGSSACDEVTWHCHVAAGALGALSLLTSGVSSAGVQLANSVATWIVA